MTERDAWDIYYAGLVAIRFHPKNDQEREARANDLQQMADVADLMIDERRKRHGMDGSSS